MTTKTFGRTELYELVWSQPRTALAKELGLSDVAIGKHCARARIPTPPVGYWAKLSAGGKVVRLPLPLRLPGQSDTVFFGNEYQRHWVRRDGGAEPPAPTSFAEDIDEQVATAAKLIGRVVATRDLSAPDSCLRRVLDSEAKRRAKYQASRWDWYKPRFDEPVYQRQLRIFSSLARALAPLYGRQEVREEEKWSQGRGTSHHLVLHLAFGGTFIELRVHEPGEPRGEKGLKPVTATTLRVGSERSDRPVLEWADQDGRKIEGQLTDIVGAVLRRAEEAMRHHAQWVYEQRCIQYQEELAAIEQRKAEAERKRLEAIEARKAKIRDEVIELSRRRRLAEDIRALVDSLGQHPEVSSPEGRARFGVWAANALAVAEGIDPMKCSLVEILGTLE